MPVLGFAWWRQSVAFREQLLSCPKWRARTGASPMFKFIAATPTRRNSDTDSPNMDSELSDLLLVRRGTFIFPLDGPL